MLTRSMFGNALSLPEGRKAISSQGRSRRRRRGALQIYSLWPSGEFTRVHSRCFEIEDPLT